MFRGRAECFVHHKCVPRLSLDGRTLRARILPIADERVYNAKFGLATRLKMPQISFNNKVFKKSVPLVNFLGFFSLMSLLGEIDLCLFSFLNYMEYFEAAVVIHHFWCPMVQIIYANTMSKNTEASGRAWQRKIPCFKIIYKRIFSKISYIWFITFPLKTRNRNNL